MKIIITRWKKNRPSHFVDTVRVFFLFKSDRRRRRCQPASNRSACLLAAAARLAPIELARGDVSYDREYAHIIIILLLCVCRCPRINLDFFFDGQKNKTNLSRASTHRTLRGEYALDTPKTKPSLNNILINVVNRLCRA